MPNIIDYVQKELEKLDTKPFHQVDSLVLSQFSYMQLDKMVPGLENSAQPVRLGDLLRAEMFDFLLKEVWDKENNLKLLFLIVASPRFRDIKINYFVNTLDIGLEKQFSAVTFLLEDDTAYIAFRGTDTSFVGWKEDFNMAFISPIPSQEEGLLYLETVAKLIPNKLRVGGHSKGGNIAVYSAMNADPVTQDRIIDIYDHDGPGFKESVFESSAFLNIKSRIHKTMPQSSLIGMLLEQQEQYTVVESNKFGIFQHDPFSWSVDNGDFIYAKKVSSGAKYMHMTLKQWLATLPDDKRKQFVDALYQVIESTKAVSIYELTDDWRKGANILLEAVKNADPETKRFVSKTVNELVKMSFRNFYNTKNKFLYEKQ